MGAQDVLVLLVAGKSAEFAKTMLTVSSGISTVQLP